MVYKSKRLPGTMGDAGEAVYNAWKFIYKHPREAAGIGAVGAMLLATGCKGNNPYKNMSIKQIKEIQRKTEGWEYENLENLEKKVRTGKRLIRFHSDLKLFYSIFGGGKDKLAIFEADKMDMLGYTIDVGDKEIYIKEDFDDIKLSITCPDGKSIKVVKYDNGYKVSGAFKAVRPEEEERIYKEVSDEVLEYLHKAIKEKTNRLEEKLKKIKMLDEAYHEKISDSLKTVLHIN